MSQTWVPQNHTAKRKHNFPKQNHVLILDTRHVGKNWGKHEDTQQMLGGIVKQTQIQTYNQTIKTSCQAFRSTPNWRQKNGGKLNPRPFHLEIHDATCFPTSFAGHWNQSSTERRGKKFTAPGDGSPHEYRCIVV